MTDPTTPTTPATATLLMIRHAPADDQGRLVGRRDVTIRVDPAAARHRWAVAANAQGVFDLIVAKLKAQALKAEALEAGA